VERWEYMAQMLGLREPDYEGPNVRREPPRLARDPGRYPGQRGAPPGIPQRPPWLQDARRRVPSAGLPGPVARPPNFPIGPGGITSPEPWEVAPAPRVPFASVNGQEPSLQGDVASLFAPFTAPIMEAMPLPQEGAGGPQRGLEPASAPPRPRRLFWDDWRAAEARARAQRRPRN
jgi:hypothetical protein